MSYAKLFAGDLPLFPLTHAGWKLEDVAGIYTATTTYNLTQIHEFVTGKNVSIISVKELSERTGRPILVYTQEGCFHFYTPQEYLRFVPLILTYSAATNLFGMTTDSQTHHDYIYYLCASGLRLENIFDFPNHVACPYLVDANKTTDHDTKLELLHQGRVKLEALAIDMEGFDCFAQTVASVLKEEKRLSELHSLSKLKTRFHGGRLSDVDKNGLEYSTQLSGFLEKHGGCPKVAAELRDASVDVNRQLDSIAALTVGQRLTDELLAVMYSKSTMVAKLFTERMTSYNINIENDVFPWTTLSSMEAGGLSDTYVRHEVFRVYRNKKMLKQDAFARLKDRKSCVAMISIDSTVHMVSIYIDAVKGICEDVDMLLQTSGPLPNITTFQSELAEMKIRGAKYDQVVRSLCEFTNVTRDLTLADLVQRVVDECKTYSLQTVMGKSRNLSHIVLIGKSLQHISLETNLQNACFEMRAEHLNMVSKLLAGDVERTLKVNFSQGTVATDVVSLQPMGNYSASPFITAVMEWDELKKKVELVAQGMTSLMLKFNHFGVDNPNLIVSRKLHSISEYEGFAECVQHWNITDRSELVMKQRIDLSMKFVRLILAAFPDQDCDRCSALRSFSVNTNLTYTLDKNDSIVNVVQKHHMYSLDCGSSATPLASIDVTTLAKTYTAATAPLQVTDIVTLVHYLLNCYEKNGTYASLLFHLSQNTERVSVLDFLLRDHLAKRIAADTQEQMVLKICNAYTSSFTIPYMTDIACLPKVDKLERVEMMKMSDFLATCSILSRLITNRILGCVDLSDPKVAIQELLMAIAPRRLYMLIHRGETLDLGRHVPLVNAAFAHTGWRERLLVQLEPKQWSVFIGDIIELHSGIYSPGDNEQNGPALSAFFLGHEDQSLVTWSVHDYDQVHFPDHSPDSLDFGSVNFQSRCHSPVSSIEAVSPGHVELTDAGSGLFTEKISTHCNDNIVNREHHAPSNHLYDMQELTDAIDAIREEVPSPSHNHIPKQVHLLSNQTLSQKANTESKGEHLFTQVDTVQMQPATFVMYRATVSPWHILRSQNGIVRNQVQRLMQARVGLSDSSEDSDS